MMSARRRDRAPVPGGVWDVIDTVSGNLSPIVEGAGKLLDGLVGVTACNPALDNLRKPLADVWEGNQAAIQTAISVTQLPPFIALGAIVEPLAWCADAVASCEVTEATKRAACRMVQKVTFIGPVLQSPQVHQALSASAGATSASVFAAFGHTAKVAELVAKPFCEGKFPTGTDAANLALNLAALADKINKAGGPDVLQMASGVLEPLLGDGLACIQAGSDPKDCVDAVLGGDGYKVPESMQSIASTSFGVYATSSPLVDAINAAKEAESGGGPPAASGGGAALPAAAAALFYLLR